MGVFEREFAKLFIDVRVSKTNSIKNHAYWDSIIIGILFYLIVVCTMFLKCHLKYRVQMSF